VFGVEDCFQVAVSGVGGAVGGVSDTLVEEIGLKSIPHFTTLQKFAARFPCRILEQLIMSIAN